MNAQRTTGTRLALSLTIRRGVTKNHGRVIYKGAGVVDSFWYSANSERVLDMCIEYDASSLVAKDILAHEFGHVLLTYAREGFNWDAYSSKPEATWQEECAAWAVAQAVANSLDLIYIAECLQSYNVPEWARKPSLHGHMPTRDLLRWLGSY